MVRACDPSKERKENKRKGTQRRKEMEKHDSMYVVVSVQTNKFTREKMQSNKSERVSE